MAEYERDQDIRHLYVTTTLDRTCSRCKRMVTCLPFSPVRHFLP